MDKAYIGIDVGAQGFISVMHPSGELEFLALKDTSPHRWSIFFQQLYEKYDGDVVCCMEEIHAIFGSSAKATFSFGEVNGMLKGLLISNHIPFHLVQPKNWQKEIWINDDRVYDLKPSKNESGKTIKKINNKKTSFNAGRRLFPDVDFRRTPQCIKDDDNKCDSLLICEYGRRKNL